MKCGDLDSVVPAIAGRAGPARRSFERGGARSAPSLQVWLGLLLTLASCSDSNLQPKDRDQPPPIDNLLSLSGSLCTDAPESTNYPVKILFVIDASGSMQFTDPNKRIKDAVNSLKDRLASNPSVKFAVITFNGIVRVNSADKVADNNMFDHVTGQSLGAQAHFFQGSQLPKGAIDAITIRDAVTDYQGALGATYRLLETDMLASSPADRTRSKYVVIFLSDGWPNPQCHSDCANAQQQPVCADRSTLPQYAKDAYPELKTCQDYNLPYQIFAKVDQIMRLRDVYSVGDMRFHTVWLRDPNDTTSGQFGYKPEDARDLLFKMATEHGNGTFADFYKGDDVNFTKVDYSAILRPFGLAQVLAFNSNAIPTPTGYAVDTDGDGISDEDEYKLGTDPLQADTDGDGYSDGFELQRMARGFDPKDPSKPFFPCIDRSDLDGDGLLDCEEAVVGTDPRLTDTDGDHIPDGLEVRYGTDPLMPDDAIDSDADGVFNLQEFAAHTDPLAVDPILYRDHRASYSIVDRGENSGQRHCYDFTANHIELVSTLGQKGSASRGVNRVFLYFGQAPRDSGAHDSGHWRVACIDPVWLAPMYKLPATGQLVLKETDLHDAAAFDPKGQCVQVSPPVAP